MRRVFLDFVTQKDVQESCDAGLPKRQRFEEVEFV